MAENDGEGQADGEFDGPGDAETGETHDMSSLLGEIEKYRDIKPVRKYLITEMLSTMPDQDGGAG